MITDSLYNHSEKQNIMAIEQRVARTAWIDYKKAFASVPHSWIIKYMTLYKVHPMITNFIKSIMTRWKTNMTLAHKQGILETGPFSIN